MVGEPGQGTRYLFESLNHERVMLGPAGRLAARISQQELADAVGSVREVVARVLRELRVAEVIATAADRIVILEAARLYAESGGSAGL